MDLSYFNGILLVVMWQAYLFILLFPIYYFFVGKFIVMAIYLPVILISFKKPHVHPTAAFVWLQAFLW
jgi:hypothetical protein